MIMYSTISEDEYRLLQKTGRLECDATKAVMPNESKECAIAYRFMSDKLRAKFPSSLTYPRWAWTMWEGEDVSKQPDVFFAGEPNRKYYRLKLDIKEFLLSDFYAWHSCLWLAPLTYTEDEDAQFDYWQNIARLSSIDVFLKDNIYTRNLRTKIVKTWNRIFDIEAKNDYALPDEKSIQAVFWTIHRKDVLEVKEILVDNKVFTKYNKYYA